MRLCYNLVLYEQQHPWFYSPPLSTLGSDNCLCRFRRHLSRKGVYRGAQWTNPQLCLRLTFWQIGIIGTSNYDNVIRCARLCASILSESISVWKLAKINWTCNILQGLLSRILQDLSVACNYHAIWSKNQILSLIFFNDLSKKFVNPFAEKDLKWAKSL